MQPSTTIRCSVATKKHPFDSMISGPHTAGISLWCTLNTSHIAREIYNRKSVKFHYCFYHIVDNEECHLREQQNMLLVAPKTPQELYSRGVYIIQIYRSHTLTAKRDKTDKTYTTP